jgi:hypothetical protein
MTASEAHPRTAVSGGRGQRHFLSYLAIVFEPTTIAIATDLIGGV